MFAHGYVLLQNMTKKSTASAKPAHVALNRSVTLPMPARTILLFALLSGPATGGQLIRRVRDATSGEVELLHGSAYPALDQLVAKKLVSSKMNNGHLVYQLTSQGEKEAEYNKKLIFGVMGIGNAWFSAYAENLT